MVENALAIVVIILYTLLTILFSYRLASGGKGLSKLRLLSFASVILLLHAYLLYKSMFAGPALDISFFAVFSLVAWVIALMLISFAWQEPIENLANSENQQNKAYQEGSPKKPCDNYYP